MIQSSTQQHLFSGILHPTDYSPGGEAAFIHSLKLGLEATTKLNIVHVDSSLEEVIGPSEFPGVRRMLSRWNILPDGAARSDVRKTGLRVSKTLYLGTSAAQCVLEELARDPADLVVLATHRRSGIDRLLHAEIANRISRFSRTLTLFIPYGVSGFVNIDDGESSLKRILLPVDTVPWPQAAVDAASAIANVLGSSPVEFILVHVGADEPEMPELDFPKQSDWHWNQTVRDGDVVEQILSLADERSVDLIAMTTQGHDGFLDALRGSTTERVLQAAECPVLAVPAGWCRTDAGHVSKATRSGQT